MGRKKNILLVQCLKFVMLGVLLSSSTQLLGQTTDTELWTGGTFKLKVNKSFRIEIEEQLRFNQEVSNFKYAFAEFGTRYKVNKHFSLKGNFRYVTRPNKNNKTRVSLDAYYRWNKKKFPLSFVYRARIQNTRENVTAKSAAYLRNKLSIGYNLSKLVDPSIAYELYFRFNGKNEFRVTRLTASLDWRLGKNTDLSTFYRIQNDINIKRPDRQNIFGLSFSHQVKLKKKKI